MLNDVIALKIMSGKVKVVDRVVSLGSRAAHLEGARTIQDVDVVIFATGYERNFPFIDKGIVEPAETSGKCNTSPNTQNYRLLKLSRYLRNRLQAPCRPTNTRRNVTCSRAWACIAFLSSQVRSDCTFRPSCCSARLSRARVPAFAGCSVLDREKKGGLRGGGGTTACTGGYKGVRAV